MTEAEAYQAFDRVVSSLVSNSLWRKDELRAGFGLGFGPGVHIHEKTLPDVERLRSLMLDFRKLISKDPISLNAVANRVLKPGGQPSLSDTQREALLGAKRRFNQVLDAEAEFYRGDQPPTVRSVLNDWINGDWFHEEDAKRERRRGQEILEDEDLSLVMIVSAVRQAIPAAVEVRDLIANQRGNRNRATRKQHRKPNKGLQWTPARSRSADAAET